MDYSAEYERCMDFLARMIEKYRDQVDLPDMPMARNTKELEGTVDRGDKNTSVPFAYILDEMHGCMIYLSWDKLYKL